MGWMSKKVEAAKAAASTAVKNQVANAKDSATTAVKNQVRKVTGSEASAVGGVLVLQGSGSMQNDVVGESHYVQAIASAVRRREGEHFMRVALVREPTNRVDPNAIAVQIGGSTVGYIAREDTAAYHPLLLAGERAGLRVEVDARVFWTPRDGGIGSVKFDLDDPATAWPLNGMPDAPTVLWPRGRRLKVTVEPSHMPVVAELLGRAYHPGRGGCFVTLGAPHDDRGKVEVLYEGRVLGSLSPATGKKMIEAIRLATSVGRSVVAFAEVTGNALVAEARILVKPTEELTAAEIADFAAPVAPPPTT